MSILQRLQRSRTESALWCPCTDPEEEDQPQEGCDPAVKYFYEPDSTHPHTVFEFSPGDALPGETLDLFYRTTNLAGQPITLSDPAIGSPDTVGGTIRWQGWFERDDYCTHKFQERVEFTILLIPDTVVKFSRLASNNVYPYYPAIRNDTVTAGVKKRFVDLGAKIAFGDSLLRNYSIRVEKPVLVDSGGHSHNSTRPPGTYRIPKESGIGFDTVNTFFVRKTDTSGVLKFRFLASQFGGVERIKARTVSDSTKGDTVSLFTRVPGLQLLTEGTNFVKVGGTCNHHGPGGPTNCALPDNSHWGTFILIENLRAIADSFATPYVGYRLRINDISLYHGGGFDIFGRWEQDVVGPGCRQSGFGHCTHRAGETADVSFLVVNPQGNSVTLTDTQRLRLERIITSVSGAPIVHSDHFHVQ